MSSNKFGRIIDGPNISLCSSHFKWEVVGIILHAEEKDKCSSLVEQLTI